MCQWDTNDPTHLCWTQNWLLKEGSLWLWQTENKWVVFLKTYGFGGGRNSSISRCSFSSRAFNTSSGRSPSCCRSLISNWQHSTCINTHTQSEIGTQQLFCSFQLWMRLYDSSLTSVPGFTCTSSFTPPATDCFFAWVIYDG